jgi:hypothetical protein
MASPLDILTTGAITGIPNGGGVVGGLGALLNDPLNPDQKAKLSAILARNGWGEPNTSQNRRGRTVVRRESNGRAKARNPIACSKSGDHAIGLFQMCTIHKGTMGIPADMDEAVKWLEDPDNNAKSAHELFTRNAWQPWSASGGIPAETTWDPEITTDKDTLTGGIGEVASDVASPFTSIASAATDLISSLLSADTWFRIGKTWLGSVFIITGTGALVFIIANQASGGKVARVAKTAATKGIG